MSEFGPVISPDSPAFDAAKAAQAQAADPTLSTWVEANAGSGKTKVLIDRVARLLLTRPDGRPGAPPDSILCVTYTKAAANEMLSRLFGRLGDWSIASDDELREELAALEGRDPAAYSRDALRQARSLFARALETPGGLRIETIHAFCARILRRFPLEAGISPGFSEIEEKDADELWNTVLAERLTDAAHAHPDALRILSETAGGLGANAALDALKSKRADITAFAHRFERAGQGDMAGLVRTALDAPDQTPDQIIEQVMGDALPRAELKSLPDILETSKKPTAKDLKLAAAIRMACSDAPADQRWEAYSSVFQTQKGWVAKDPYSTAHRGDAVMVDLFQTDGGYGSEISRLMQAVEKLAAAKAAERTLALLTIGLPMVTAYADEKRQRAVLDFDDLIRETRDLLTKSGAAQWVLYKLDGGLTHLLLDEAQDTSPPQWDLITELVKEFQSGHGRDRLAEPRTQFVVGDPKQSIYSFQGADEAFFRQQKQEFLRREEPLAEAENRNTNLPEMAMSFRSSPEILTFVDEVRARIPLTDAAIDPLPPVDADLIPHQARRANQPGRVELWPLEMPTESDASESNWTAPTDHIPEDAPRRRLAAKVAREIREMIDQGETVWQEGADRKWSRKPIEPQDVLILVRSRNDLFDALIESLKSENLPVAGADRLKLLENAGVQDCLNLIRFALQPADDLTLAEILRGPFCGLTDDDNHLFVLAHGRKAGETLWDRLRITRVSAFEPARNLCLSVLERRDLPAFDFLTYALTTRREDGLNGWDRLVQRLGEPVRDPVRALVSGALGHDMAEPKSLQTYLAETEGDETELKRDLGEPSGAIRVMTVHGAKGLQAPVVILPDTTGGTKNTKDQVFIDADSIPVYAPSAKLDCPKTALLRDQKNIAGERESRRLLYVALTRASDRLIIAGAGSKTPKQGFAKSSWYRWCLTAMQALSGNDPSLSDMPAMPESKLTFGQPSPQRKQQAKTKDKSAAPPAWLTAPAPASRMPIRLAAPSRLLDDTSPVSAPFGTGRSAALRRGRLIHSLLQILPNLPPKARKAHAEHFLAHAPETSRTERDEMLSVTFETLNHPEFAPIFGPNGRNEASIVGALPDGRMINGRVDRLIITDTQVLIIDYKTDRPAPTDARDVGQSYIVQMAAYRAVLQQLYPGKSRTISCALLYTDGPRLITLDNELLSESLNRVQS